MIFKLDSSSKCLCVHKHFIEHGLTVIPFFFVWNTFTFINFIPECMLIQNFKRNRYGDIISVLM